jgi:hypothetical protein
MGWFRGDFSLENLPEWAPEYLDIYDIVEFSGWDIQTIRGTRVVDRDRLLMIHRAKQRAQASRNEGG